jgi:hypothetical protein
VRWSPRRCASQPWQTACSRMARHCLRLELGSLAPHDCDAKCLRFWCLGYGFVLCTRAEGPTDFTYPCLRSIRSLFSPWLDPLCRDSRSICTCSSLGTRSSSGGYGRRWALRPAGISPGDEAQVPCIVARVLRIGWAECGTAPGFMELPALLAEREDGAQVLDSPTRCFLYTTAPPEAGSQAHLVPACPGQRAAPHR